MIRLLHMQKKFLLNFIFLSILIIFSSDLISKIMGINSAFLVHKTTTCGCCKEWVKHAKESEFRTYTQDHQTLEKIKNKYNIKPEYRSCHTTVSSDGYVFEGHIPSKFITKFLSESHPNAIGLSVPGMPLGSPGMEVGNRFMPYKILILYKDGTSEIYAEVKEK